MCVIVDANAAREVFGTGRPPAGQGFFDWIDSGSGRLIAGGKLLKELARLEEFNRWWQQATLAGVAGRVKDDVVRAETTRLVERGACRSNDAHVVALALVGGARLLYTNDRKLQRDFKDRQLISGPPGKIYSTRRSTAFKQAKKALLAGSSCRLAVDAARG